MFGCLVGRGNSSCGPIFFAKTVKISWIVRSQLAMSGRFVPLSFLNIDESKPVISIDSPESIQSSTDSGKNNNRYVATRFRLIHHNRLLYRPLIGFLYQRHLIIVRYSIMEEIDLKNCTKELLIWYDNR